MLCEYGCGNEAKYKFGNDKWCCSTSYNKCPINKKNNSDKNKHKHKPRTTSFEEIHNSDLLCDYGCGKIAKYRLFNKKLCCEKNYSRCTKVKSKNPRKKIKKEKPELCDYGCGNEARYYVKSTNKWCCNIDVRRCSGIIHRSSTTRTGKTFKKQPYSEEKLNLIYKKMFNSMVKNGHWVSKNLLAELIIYRRQVERYTNVSKKEKFSPRELKTIGSKKGENHIDHIFSVLKGFELGILPRIIVAKEI